MSAGDLTAKFVLRLEDKLSAGLGKLQQRLEKISSVAAKLSTPGLDATEKVLRKIDGASKGASEALSALGEKIVYVGQDGAAAIGRIARELATVRRLAAEPLRLSFAGGGGGGRGGIPLNLGGGGRGGGNGGSLGEHLERFNEAGEGAAGGIFGALAAGFGIGEAIEKAEELDNILRHIAITTGSVGVAGDRMVAQLRQQYQTLARETGQSTNAIAEAGFYLIQAGLAPDVVEKLTRQSARIATAYNADPQEVAKTAFVLAEQLHINPGDMGGSLAALALAGKQSHILFPEMAQLFPQIAAEGVNAGETGRSGVDRMAAMLAIARKNTATGGEAATNMRDFLGQLNSPFEAKHFAALGIDLQGLMKNAKAQGVDPIEAVLAKVQQVTHGDPALLGRLFHNEQSRAFVLAMLQHHDEYVRLLKQLGGADEGMLGQDFTEGLKSLHVQMGLFMAEVNALVDRVGRGLAPVMGGLAFVLHQVNNLFAEMDAAVPGLSGGIIATVGGVLALGGAFGLIRVVLPFLTSGFALFGSVLRLVLSPFGLLNDAVAVLEGALVAVGIPAGVAAGAVLAAALVLAGAALLIWRDWEGFRDFFVAMWEGINTAVNGAYEMIAGILTLDFPRIVAGLEAVWGGLGTFFTALWDTIKGVFDAFVAWVDGWSGGLGTRILDGIKSGWASLVTGFAALFDELMGPVHAFENSWVGRQLGLAGGDAAGGGALAFDSPAGGARHQVGGQITVRVDGPGRVTGARSDNAGVPIVPDRGDMLGRD